MNLTRALGSVGGLTLASRVLGLVRDSLFARFVGAGFASDAFLIAFRLPNMFRALFAEGAFSAAFIPMFNRKVAEGDRSADGAGLPAGRGRAARRPVFWEAGGPDGTRRVLRPATHRWCRTPRRRGCRRRGAR